MNTFIKSSLPSLNIEQLTDLIADSEQRIGSNVAGGDPNEAYVQQQREFIKMVYEEIEQRQA